MKTCTADPSGVEIDGAKVRQLRKLAGATITTFAQQAALSTQYVSQLERGVRQNVSPPAFARICNALGVPPEQRAAMVRPTTTPAS
ncbi:MAG TPA: helix-turn-helix transcriptional regulator [Micromonosporaceae bacterium]|nr:helix-turn-helix transcriptional regulator [Micromonosporaceae bacterium]